MAFLSKPLGETPVGFGRPRYLFGSVSSPNQQKLNAHAPEASAAGPWESKASALAAQLTTEVAQ